MRKKMTDVRKGIDKILENVKRMLEFGKRKTKKFWLVGFLSATPLLLIVMIGGAYQLAYRGRVYPGLMVVGVTVGNKTKIEVANILSAQTQLIQSPRLLLIDKGWQKELDLSEFDFTYEVSETVEKVFAFGRSGRLMRDSEDKIFAWFQGQEFGLDYKLSAEFEEEIERLNEEVSVPVMAPEIVIVEKDEGKSVEVKSGADGRRLNQERLLKIIDERIRFLNFSEIMLPVEAIRVGVSEAEVLMTKARAEQLLGQSLNYEYENQTWTIEDATLISCLSFESGFDGEKIASFSAQVAQKIDREPENAVFQFVPELNKVEEFKSSQVGWRLDQEQLKKDLEAALLRLETGEVDEKPIELVVETMAPEITTENVNDLGIRELLGRGQSTFHGSIAGREYNIALAASKLNGLLVKPGEVFSFNDAVGDVSAATGYRSSYIIREGRTVLDDGGGVCQDSTTLFRAILAAGLPIVERQAHAYRVYYYEQGWKPGFDATVFAPTADLKFRNNTPAWILIQAEADLAANTLVIDFYGTSDGREVEISNYRMWDVTPPPEDLYQDDPTLPAGVVKQVDWKAWGAKVKFDYRVRRDGEVIFEKTFYSNFRPWQAVFLRGTG